MIPTPTPIVLSGPTDGPGIPAYIVVLLIGVIVVQGLAFFRRRRR